MVPARGPDHEPVRRAVLHRRAAGTAGLYEHGGIHRASVSRDQRRVSSAEVDVLRAGCADPRLDRHALQVLTDDRNALESMISGNDDLMIHSPIGAINHRSSIQKSSIHEFFAKSPT